MNKKLTKNSDGTYKILDLGSRQTLNFNTAGRLTSMVDRNNNSTTISYSGSTITSVQSPVAAEKLTFASDSSGHVTSTTRMSGSTSKGTTSYAYDEYGHLASIKQNGTTVASFLWSPGGDLGLIIDGVGHATSFAYDSNHRVTQVQQGEAGLDMAVTRIAYLSSGSSEWTDVADPNSDQSVGVGQALHTIYDIDSSTRLVKDAKDPYGHIQSRTYTPFNDVQSSTTADQGTTTNDWSSNSGRSLKSSTSATGASSSFTYGTGVSQYSPSGSTDTQGNQTSYQYDKTTGNPTSTSGHTSGASASVTYNQDGTVATSTDPVGNVTTYAEDAAAKYVNKITPPTGSNLGATSIVGNPVTSVTNGAGQTTTYSYDDYFNVTKIVAGDVTVSYAYDADNRVISRTDNQQKTVYTYDVRGNLASVATTPVAAGAPAARTVTYTHDLVGNTKTRTVDGKTTTYYYDATNYLSTMVNVDGTDTTFAYDADRRRTDTYWHVSADRKTWVAHSHTDFDKSGRIIRSWTSGPSTSTTRLFDNSYGYHLAGKDTGLIQTVTNNSIASGNVATLRDDAQNRVVSAINYNNVKGNDGHSFVYAYDKNATGPRPPSTGSRRNR